ncbi:MAG TPA: hypothetical protein DEP35_21465 [Deltaproteobacteria bacterium]|nr:hypothetical protein [Deltaproteobacteria bacterium]
MEKAKIADKDAFADEATLINTTDRLASILDRFDASRECAHVTCLYNTVNWWIERMIEDQGEGAEVEPSAEYDDDDTFL